LSFLAISIDCVLIEENRLVCYMSYDPYHTFSNSLPSYRCILFWWKRADWFVACLTICINKIKPSIRNLS
jgi:hypothetical protein